MARKSQNIHLEKKFLQGIEEHFKFNALGSAKSGINIAKNQTWRENMIKIILMVKNKKWTKIRASSEMPFMKIILLNSEV